jgi:predicted molibdopterin-dependent oxidoreductase YjgC
MGMDSSLRGGMSGQAMINSIGTGIHALYLAGEDLMGKARADADLVKSQLEKLDFLVVQEMFLTPTAELADVVFPVTSFAESQGTQVNNGSQIQFVRRVIPPVAQARPDWMVVNSLAKLLGVDFGYQGQVKNVFKAISANIQGYSGLSHNLLANEGPTQIERPKSDLGKIDRADLLDRLSTHVARLFSAGRRSELDTSEMTAKAGSILQKRYPLITRYSEMISPNLLEEENAERPAPVIFPA